MRSGLRFNRLKHAKRLFLDAQAPAIVKDNAEKFMSFFDSVRELTAIALDMLVALDSLALSGAPSVGLQCNAGCQVAKVIVITTYFHNPFTRLNVLPSSLALSQQLVVLQVWHFQAVVVQKTPSKLAGDVFKTEAMHNVSSAKGNCLYAVRSQ